MAQVEIHTVQSTTFTDREFLSGGKDGRAVLITGELRLPRPGTDRLPAVVLLHGSGGINGGVTDWAQDLNSMGIPTFVLDSFTGRGIVSTIDDQAQLGRLAMIVDAYRALDLLSKHARIDPARIAVMGFSRGGQAALYASMKRFQAMHGVAGEEFAAYVSFYPDCSCTYLKDEEVAKKPIRVFHGSADDYNPVAPCRAYVERLKAAGKDVVLTEYAGAAHVFDWQALAKPEKLEKAQRTGQCVLAESQGGVIINAKTKQTFTYADACVELGATIAFDANASSEARRAVKEFFAVTLKP